MWKRFRRRSMAPRRPVLFPGQYVLAAVTILVLIGSIAALVVVLSYR
jgi:hypothetical protein